MISDQQLENVFLQTEQENNVQVTYNARTFIALCVRGIYEDPRPSWQPVRPHAELEQIADAVVNNLPDYLSHLTAYSLQLHPDTRTVTVFDAIHWTSDHLNQLYRIVFGADK